MDSDEARALARSVDSQAEEIDSGISITGENLAADGSV